jgi:hypothetical protein
MHLSLMTVYNHYVDFIKRDKNRETRFGEVRFASCQLYDAKIEEREEAENLARSNPSHLLARQQQTHNRGYRQLTGPIERRG